MHTTLYISCSIIGRVCTGTLLPTKWQQIAARTQQIQQAPLSINWPTGLSRVHRSRVRNRRDPRRSLKHLHMSAVKTDQLYLCQPVQLQLQFILSDGVCCVRACECVRTNLDLGEEESSAVVVVLLVLLFVLSTVVVAQSRGHSTSTFDFNVVSSSSPVPLRCVAGLCCPGGWFA